MFYLGGASKKKAVKEIFKVPKSDNDDKEDEDDAISERSRSRSRSRSQSRSRSRSRISNRTDNDETTTDTDDTDTDADSIKEENHDYIATLGSIDTDGLHHRYKFVEDELDYDIEEFAEQNPEIKHYDLVIYRINTKSTTPFLEFLFYYENSVCKLPYYKHAPKKHIRKESDHIMSNLFTGKYRFKGYLHDKLTDKCFIFYEKYFREEQSRPVKLSIQKSHNWYWICTTEIIYQKRYMSLSIDDEAVDLFIAYPLIGLLQATVPNIDTRVRRRSVRGNHDNDERFHTVHIEAPTILYYGSTLCYAKNTALYGLKREPLTSRFGPFYYLTTLDHAYYWACYHNTSKHTSKERNSEGGISRYAVFTKRMKTVFPDDDYDVDMVKKYVERTNMFEANINQNRQTQETYHHDMYHSLYSYDYSWTTDFDTIYNGYYDQKRIVRPAWCVCDHRNLQLLSYYEVNMESIPNTYDPEYSSYTIM